MAGTIYHQKYAGYVDLADMWIWFVPYDVL